MLENFDRCPGVQPPEILKKHRFRDIGYKRLHTGSEVIDRFVKCDGEVHIVELETVVFDLAGNPMHGQVEKNGNIEPCNCSEEDIAKGDKVWGIFH